MLRHEQIEDMIDKTYKMMEMLSGHTVEECISMIAALVGVVLVNEGDLQEREQILKELVDIIRSSVYDEGGEVYVDRVIED
jgi:hypothetical protein|tara:strand:- start:1419 stop:1661 length:243 start_codon:yes stop_codon:yes gene_type:complete